MCYGGMRYLQLWQMGSFFLSGQKTFKKIILLSKLKSKNNNLFTVYNAFQEPKNALHKVDR